MFDENAAKHALDILKQRQTTMFIGAGIGVEAGLPDWSNAIIELSNYIREYDRSISSIMLERVENKNLLSAAQLYFHSETTQDIQITGLEKVFGKTPNINRNIKNLVGLKALNFITTNYDFTIENAWAEIKGKSLASFSNTEDDFISAHRHLNSLNPFIIHIHGIITKPMHLVLSRDHFNKIKENESYMTLLRHIMMNNSFLFVGFSFYDPAISLFLEYIKDKVQLKCDKTSFAAIPDNNRSISDFLTSSNIIPIVYESRESHKGLWELIRWLYDESKINGKVPKTKVRQSENEILKLKYNLASVYTHFRIRSQYKPVYESILKGIIHFIGYSLNFQKESVTKERLSLELSSFLHIGNSEAEAIVINVLESLIMDKKVALQNSYYEFSPIDDSIDTHLNILVQSIKDRASVRYATSLPFKNDDIREFLLSVLVTDGVRLAHTILSKCPIPTFSIQDIFEKCYDDMNFSQSYRNIFIRSAMSLFESPNQSEAKILGEISRTAFLTDLTYDRKTRLASILLKPPVESIFSPAGLVV